MFAKHCDKKVVGTVTVYFVEDTPVAIYEGDTKKMISPHGRNLVGFGDMPEIVFKLVTSQEGSAVTMPPDLFLKEVTKYVKIRKKTKPKSPKPVDPIVSSDMTQREAVVIDAIQQAVLVHGDMVCVSEIRDQLETMKVDGSDDRWVNDLIYRLFKDGKLISEKRGGKRFYKV
jgi:hypothetical protein